ncbi:hypothetical protein BCR34DRAFT_599107 [Clohesyomyces aquaticus]|uniref:tyrosinase n=1 Tax=Clohesyomyces aquaticus TaxID=1231657 RepID=A0A1Y1ZWF3_9PLEO|nr:hypothetical protein BCR34DRAFT_599107 [Clohesyomyces aquaticus]
MKVLQFFSLTLLAALATAVAVPRDHPLHVGDAGVVLVTGVGGRDKSGHVPVRREIRDLQTNFPDQWNVYILGLRSFQLTDQSDPVSFYQIAGIHGRPYVPWQGVEGIPGKQSGYCPHSNALFFGWHRAYLVLYEQELYRHIQQIAALFPEDLRERYISAAENFRIPYWDWALGASDTVPDVFVTPTISVVGTDGLPQTIPNPLYRYEFHPVIPGDFDDDFAHMNTTVRWPTSQGSAGVSQDNKFISYSNGQSKTMHDNIASGYANAGGMNRFSVAYLENIHGWVHFSIGGGDKPAGHMWPVQVSAFEPLFMLHHCQVDRLFELWIAANPDKYIEPQTVKDGTFTIEDNTVVDADTPLKPFWSTPAAFWTTNQVRDTTLLGYAYPETMRWNFSNDEMYGAHINATISQLYGSSARARLSQAAERGQGSDLAHLNTDDSFLDWSIDAEASSDDMPATFIVRFSFVGIFSSDPVVEVGSWTRLMSAGNVVNPNKMKRASTLAPNLKGSVSLTGSLMDDIVAQKLESLDAGAVVPYLKERLAWKVFAGDGTLIPHDRVQSLAVKVISTEVHIPSDPDKPLEYSDTPVYYPEITDGKGGSANAIV